MSGSGCPYCAGRKVLPGFNDLVTLAPEVAKQWHPALNGNLTPEMVTAGTKRKVWWECDQGMCGRRPFIPAQGRKNVAAPSALGESAKNA